MKIRSMTAFTEVTYPLEGSAVAKAGNALRSARSALEQSGFEVQTTRLATQPFPAILVDAGPGKVGELAQDVEAISFVHEIDYAALGPVRLDDPAAYVEPMQDIFRHTQSVFASVIVADRQNGLSLPRIRRAADLIRRVASLTDDGFSNLRLAALANVPPWAAFFPAAYHGGGAPRIAVATEAADLALTAISSAHSLADASKSLVRAVEVEAERVETAVRRALDGSGVSFEGIDFSLAPYPEEARSIGAALERRLFRPVADHQQLKTAVAGRRDGFEHSGHPFLFVTDALDRARFTRTGFCGLMLPVLEDPVLAERAAAGKFGITDLLTYSAVCGTGLDTIPLPGDISQEALAAILLDMAALALRLDKKLTARLMPLPGKQPGDEASFGFEYFASSRVLAPHLETLTGLFAGDERITIQPIGRRE